MDKLTTKLHLGALSPSSIPSIILNLIQFLSVIVLLGLVGANFNATSNNHSAAVYTIIIALITLFASSLLFYLTLSPPARRLWIILILIGQWILVVLWAATAGVLGGESQDSGHSGLKIAMAFALVEMVAWLVGGVMGSVGLCCAGRRNGKAANFA